MSYLCIADSTLKPSYALERVTSCSFRGWFLFYSFRYSLKVFIWEGGRAGGMSLRRPHGLGWFPLPSKPSLEQLSSNILILCDGWKHLQGVS